MPIVRNSKGQFAGGVLGKFARTPAQRSDLAAFIKGGKFHGADKGTRHRLGNTWAQVRRESAGVIARSRKPGSGGVILARPGARIVLRPQGLGGRTAAAFNSLTGSGWSVSRRQGRRSGN